MECSTVSIMGLNASNTSYIIHQVVCVGAYRSCYGLLVSPYGYVLQ